MSSRWRIACINWSHATAPKAVAYYFEGDKMFDRYFKTWTEAVEWTDEIVRRNK